MEGIPDCTSHLLSRGVVTAVSAAHSSLEAHAKACPPKEKRERRQGCQRLDRIAHRGKKHARARKEPQAFFEVRARSSIRRSGLERRETLGPPVTAAQSPNSAGPPRSASCGSEPGTREVRVHASRTGGRSRSDASRVLLAGRSQGLVAVRRALAGRKLQAPPDAGHEQREGESVRDSMTFPITGTHEIGLWVSARRFTRRRKALSGTRVTGLYRLFMQGPLARR